MSLFPAGPIGFNVMGHGFKEGLPMIHAVVAVKNKETPFLQECIFYRRNGVWTCGEKQRPLSEEEEDMVKSIWADKRGEMSGE